MNKLRYSPEAVNDLDEIWTYIVESLQNPTAAQKTVTGILDSVEKLREFPKMGSSLPLVTQFESDYRFLVC